MAAKKRKSVINGRPCILVKTGETEQRIWILLEGDSVSMNTSTNYDHRSEGPGMFMESQSTCGTNWIEGYSDDSQIWDWINGMVNLGMRYIEENPTADIRAMRQEYREQKTNEPDRNGDPSTNCMVKV